MTTTGAEVGPPRRGRFDAGDGIRGVAALMVIVFHIAFWSARFTAGTAAYGRIPAEIIGHLDLSVYMFFALSGYLITRAFIGNFVYGRPLPQLGDYALGRFLRIVPAFWVVFTLMLIRHGTLGTGALGVASVYLFGQNYHATVVSVLVGPAWTLDIEVVFYALVPVGAALLVLAAGRRRPAPEQRLRIVWAAIALFTGASLLARALLPETAVWQISAPAMLFAFMPGVACAAAELRARPWLRANPSVARNWSRGLLVLAAGATIAYVVGPGTITQPTRLGVAPVVAAAAAGLLQAAALAREWGGAGAWLVFGNRWSQWIGERSYSLYLVHQGILLDLIRWHVALAHPRVRFIVLLPVTLVLSLLAAAVLYASVERPGMALRRRIYAPRPVVGIGERAA